MANIDDELLALAGDSSSEDEATPQLTTAPKSESPVTAKSSSPVATQRPDSAPKPGVARRRVTKPSRPAKRTVRKGKRDDSEEEGEASSAPSSPSSLQSAPMSESESDTDPMASEGLVSRFPVEGKFTSDADKAEILALPEIKREEILAERATEIEREQQNRMLIQLLRDKEKKNREADKKKRKASAADLEENQRKSSRQKTTLGGRKVGEASAPLEQYKRQREQRVHNEQRRREDRKAADGKKEDQISDADAEGESEVDWDEGPAATRRSSSVSKEEPPAVLKDYDRARVGRSGFGKVCFYPGFNEAITGCFVRINIGVDKATGQNCYRLAQIKGFAEGKPYAIESPNGKRFVTTQYVTAAHGKAQKDWPFIICSDSPFTEAEFDRWKKVCIAESVTMATKTFLTRKVTDINNLLDRSWTDEELNEKLRRSGAAKDYLGQQKQSALKEMREQAVRQGDEAHIAELDAALAQYEAPKLAFGTTLTAPVVVSNKGPSQQERLAALNRANRKANAQDVRKAQLAEKRAERLNQAAIARGEAVANPFARVKTRAKVMHDVHAADTLAPPTVSHNVDELFEGNSDRSRAGTPMSGAGTTTPRKIGTPKRSGTPLATGITNGEKKGGIPTIRKRLMEDEILGSMDFGIDIDIDNM
ncbi:MAG: hypothetical protein M1833_005167 [Piccolia ochrophora]|nr:MAG: hypothetical protein M1833_005167 [Piccolia ochrophora]